MSVGSVPRLVHDKDESTTEQDWSGGTRKELAIRGKGWVMNMSIQREAHASQAGHDNSAPSNLKELVQCFRICWEALPDYYYVNKEKRQTGFTLELTGTHEQGVEHPQPGCEHCRKVWRALKAVGDWVIPREERDSDYDIGPFDQSIHYDVGRRFRPDVSLRIWLRHRSGFDRPVDACEVRCLNEMTQRLKELGVRKGKWVLD
jgi:hypothetical protein